MSAIVCLVGENPMPIYLSILQYADKITDVILVHSKETKEQADNITRLVNTNYKDLIVRSRLLDEPYDPVSATRLFRDIKTNHPDALLNYTGGTKVMSSFAVKAWSDLNLMLYLDETAACFRYADGATVKLKDHALTIDVLGELHGLQSGDLKDEPFEKDITDAKLKQLYNEWMKKPRGGSDRRPFMPDNWNGFGAYQSSSNPESSTSKIEDAAVWWQEFKDQFEIFADIMPPTSKNQFEKNKIFRFAATGWLELLVKRMVSKCVTHRVISNIHLSPKTTNFEVDVVTIVKNRLFYFSVTTDRDRYVKSKMFEAIYRAEQLGGGMARTAVVSVADNDLINMKLPRAFGAPPRIEFFGHEHVAEWLIDDLSSLKHFLETGD